MVGCLYHNYYAEQAGGGVGAIYKGAPYQRGHGFGSFLKGLFRSVLPIFKSGVKTIGKEALRSGSQFLGDIIAEKPVKESFETRARAAVENLKRKADDKIDLLVGSGNIKRKRSSVKNHNISKRRCIKHASSRKNKVHKLDDIFI